MLETISPFQSALQLLWNFDSGLGEIVWLSLRVSLTAVCLAGLIGLPLGAFLAIFRFPGRKAAIILLNASMGLPPVVIGLVVYMLLSRSGPMGALELLFTPSAMVIAQCVLVMPILAALTLQVIEELWLEYEEQLRSFGVSQPQAVATLLWEGRYSLATSLLAGFGRAIGEVGAVMIVGGNIAHFSRVMTTAIALETSKGDLSLALGLGIILIIVSIGVNAALYLLREVAVLHHA